jgi:glycosyltransferase involved in cell wall biosynthesis
VDGFIAVSDYYAGFMSKYLRIPQEKIHIVPLGINVEGFSASPLSGPEDFKIGFFARVAPEKGLHVLCEAYRRLRERRAAPKARLEVAGYLAPEHKQYLRAIERQMNDWGYGEEFHYRGVLDRREKIEFLKSLDVLSVPATYDEPKGIFLLEAMACGVPVVEPRRGAFTEVINKTGGGLLVDPDDADSLAEGLLTIWENPSLAGELGRSGFEGVREHYSAARMASRALEVYGDISGAKNQEGLKIRQATPA